MILLPDLPEMLPVLGAFDSYLELLAKLAGDLDDHPLAAVLVQASLGVRCGLSASVQGGSLENLTYESIEDSLRTALKALTDRRAALTPVVSATMEKMSTGQSGIKTWRPRHFSIKGQHMLVRMDDTEPSYKQFLLPVVAPMHGTDRCSLCDNHHKDSSFHMMHPASGKLYLLRPSNDEVRCQWLAAFEYYRQRQAYAAKLALLNPSEMLNFYQQHVHTQVHGSMFKPDTLLYGLVEGASDQSASSASSAPSSSASGPGERRKSAVRIGSPLSSAYPATLRTRAATLFSPSRDKDTPSRDKDTPSRDTDTPAASKPNDAGSIVVWSVLRLGRSKRRYISFTDSQDPAERSILVTREGESIPFLTLKRASLLGFQYKAKVKTQASKHLFSVGAVVLVVNEGSKETELLFSFESIENYHRFQSGLTTFRRDNRYRMLPLPLLSNELVGKAPVPASSSATSFSAAASCSAASSSAGALPSDALDDNSGTPFLRLLSVTPPQTDDDDAEGPSMPMHNNTRTRSKTVPTKPRMQTRTLPAQPARQKSTKPAQPTGPKPAQSAQSALPVCPQRNPKFKPKILPPPHSPRIRDTAKALVPAEASPAVPTLPSALPPDMPPLPSVLPPDFDEASTKPAISAISAKPAKPAKPSATTRKRAATMRVGKQAGGSPRQGGGDADSES